MSKRKKVFRRILLTMMCLVLLGGVAALGVNAHVKKVGGETILSEKKAAQLQDVDCIIVLGCQVHSDGTPSPMLRDRLETGVALYRSGAAPKLLMSGDHSREDYDEVGAMKQFALGAGVDSSDIFMDHAGFSTYETMYRAKEVYGAQKVLVVTQHYHLYRALYIAKALGLDAYGVAAADIDYAGQSYRDAREVLARCKDFVTAASQPKPKNLGEAIPISGDGNVTNAWIGTQLLTES